MVETKPKGRFCEKYIGKGMVLEDQTRISMCTNTAILAGNPKERTIKRCWKLVPWIWKKRTSYLPKGNRDVSSKIAFRARKYIEDDNEYTTPCYKGS
jgi:hypothetical protein